MLHAKNITLFLRFISLIRQKMLEWVLSLYHVMH